MQYISSQRGILWIRYSNDAVAIDMPGNYSLSQNYPNPFNPETTIEFMLQGRTNVHLAVYNLPGELITTLADREFGAGSYRVVWSGRNINGVYRIVAESFSAVKKMMLVR